MISQPQSEDRSWSSSVLEAFVSGMTAISSAVTTFQKKPEREPKTGTTGPELVIEAAQSVFQYTEMAEIRFKRYGCLNPRTPTADKDKFESAALIAGRATQAVKDYDPEFSEVCRTLEEPDGEYRMVPERALQVIERLKPYWAHNNWYK